LTEGGNPGPPSRSGPLPAVKQVQQEYGVGRDTVLRAIEIPRDEGLVFTVPRRGTYVSRDRQVAGPQGRRCKP
jgi:GntR family transcriptional regulator/MocR family aminotransferase